MTVLSEHQMLVLRLLARWAELGLGTYNAIGRVARNPTLAALVRAGCITVARDGRRAIVNLTDRGRRLAGRG